MANWFEVRAGTMRISWLPDLDRLTHHCEIVETGYESWRFKHPTSLCR